MNNTHTSEAVTALYIDHHGWLKGWLRGKLGCSDAAADLAQDTYVRIMASSRLPQREESRAYLVQVAKHLVIDLRRRRRLEYAYLEAAAQLPEALAPSEEQKAIIIQTLCRIDAALHGLPARVRETFLLSRFDGLTYSEIAAQLGMSVGAVRKYMLKAASACCTAMGGEGAA